MTETDPVETDDAGGTDEGNLRLTRRDAVLSLLAGSGATAAGLFGSSAFGGDETNEGYELTDARVDTLVAVAEVVYPSAVSGIEEFVGSYAGSLSDPRTQEVAAAVTELDDYARRSRGRRFADLSVGDRDSVLRAMGVDRTGSSSGGRTPERIRYYVVNQLLYGLYTSPRGSTLLGIEIPVGYPGGYQSYQNEPKSAPEGLVAESRNDE